MAEKEITIKNKDGIHCRPSSVIISAAQEHPDNEFFIRTSEGETALDSILSLLTLGLRKGDSATVIVTGPDAESVCDKMAELFETEFDFPPQ